MVMSDSYRVSKLTDCKWANLFEVDYARRKQPRKSWIMCSRNDEPVAGASQADAVVIVAKVDADGDKKLVVTKEFRVPIWDFEYGFPAGLIDDGEDVETTVERELKEETGLELSKILHISTPVFSSAGLTDESCHMVLVEAQG
jgi:ADP-ribose pyrophosphatase